MTSIDKIENFRQIIEFFHFLSHSAPRKRRKTRRKNKYEKIKKRIKVSSENYFFSSSLLIILLLSHSIENASFISVLIFVFASSVFPFSCHKTIYGRKSEHETNKCTQWNGKYQNNNRKKRTWINRIRKTDDSDSIDIQR